MRAYCSSIRAHQCQYGRINKQTRSKKTKYGRINKQTRHLLVVTAGRFLIRLSDSLFLAPQSDLEKNQNAVRKGLARNAQIRGVFGSPP
jgi:hypothetical protein